MASLPHVSLAFAFVMGLHFGLTFFVDENERQCPHISQRKFRIQSVCNGNSRVYTCLYNTNNKTYTEFCENNEDVRAGLKYVISGTFRNVRCSEERYQPITFSSNQGSDCLYSKSQCNEAGQIVVDDKSSIGDSKCRCDYTRKFAFVSRTRNPCFCTPSEEDCTCYIKLCPNSTELSPDYECVALDSTNKKFNCKFVTQAHENGSLIATLLKGRKTKGREVTTVSTITGSSSTLISLFVVVTVLVIVGIVGIIVLRKYSCKKDQEVNVIEQGRPLVPHQHNMINNDNVVNGNQDDNAIDDNLDNRVSKDNFKDQNKKSTNGSLNNYDFRQDAFSSNKGYQNEMEEIAVESAEELPKPITDCFNKNRDILFFPYDFKDQNKKHTDDSSNNYDSLQDSFSSDKGYQNEMEEIAVESAKLPKSITDYSYKGRDILSFSYDYSSGHHMTKGALLNDKYNTLDIHQAENLEGQQQMQENVELAQVDTLDEASIHSTDRFTLQLTEQSFTFITLVSDDRFDLGIDILSSSCDYSFGHHMSQGALLNDKNDTMSNQAENLERHQQVQDNVELTQVKALDEASIQHYSTDGYTQQLPEQRFTPVTQVSDERFDLEREILSSSCDYSSGHHMPQPAPLTNINTNTWRIHQMENLERQQQVQDNVELEQVETLDEASIQHYPTDGYTQLTEQRFTPVTQVSDERFDHSRGSSIGGNSIW